MNRAKIATTFLVAVLSIGLLSTAAAEDTDESEVIVDVSTETAVDMHPEQLSYSGITPGSEALEDDSGVAAVQIENVGSNSIDTVHMEATAPEETPFATGDRDAYDTANFVSIDVSNPEDHTDLDDSINAYDYPVFVNRKDFAEVRDLSYIFVEDEEEWEYGRFRVADEEYFWAVETSIDGSETDLELRVGTTAHTQSQTGTSDFGDGAEDYDTYQMTSVQDGSEDNPTYWVPDEAVSIPRTDSGDETIAQEDWRDYDVVVQTDPGATGGVYTVRSRFNEEVEGVDLTTEGSVTDYIFNSDGASVLEPGDSFPVDVNVNVPRGVPSGDASSPGILTVVVTGSE